MYPGLQYFIEFNGDFCALPDERQNSKTKTKPILKLVKSIGRLFH